MKLEELKPGQIIELRWEFWNKPNEVFRPRTIHMVLVQRVGKPMESPSSGWRAKVFYDSSPKEMYEKKMPYDNVYYDTWLNMSMQQGKLNILWTPENEV